MPPVCGDDIVLPTSQLTKQTLPSVMKYGEIAMTGQTHTKCVDVLSENTPNVWPILAQRKDESIQHQDEEVQPHPSILYMAAQTERSGMKSRETQEIVKQTSDHEMAVVKKGLSKPLVVTSKKSIRRNETKGIQKSDRLNISQQSSNAFTSYLEETPVHAESFRKDAMVQFETIFNDRGQDVRIGHLKEKLVLTSVTAPENSQSDKKATVEPTPRDTSHNCNEYVNRTRFKRCYSRNVAYPLPSLPPSSATSTQQSEVNMMLTETQQQLQPITIQRKDEIVPLSCQLTDTLNVEPTDQSNEPSIKYRPAESANPFERGDRTVVINYGIKSKASKYRNARKPVRLRRKLLLKLSKCAHKLRKCIVELKKTREEPHAKSGETEPSTWTNEEGTAFPAQSQKKQSIVAQQSYKMHSKNCQQMHPSLVKQSARTEISAHTSTKSESMETTPADRSHNYNCNGDTIHFSSKRKRIIKELITTPKIIPETQMSETHRESIAMSHDKEVNVSIAMQQLLHSDRDASPHQEETLESLSSIPSKPYNSNIQTKVLTLSEEDTNSKHVQSLDDSRPLTIQDHKTDKQSANPFGNSIDSMTNIPKRRMYVPCGKRRRTSPRHGIQTTEWKRRTRPPSFWAIRETLNANSEPHNQKLTDHSEEPCDMQSREHHSAIPEVTRDKIGSQPSAEVMNITVATTKKLSNYRIRWNAKPRSGTHSFISTRENEQSSHSTVSGSSYSVTRKPHCLPNYGARTMVALPRFVKQSIQSGRKEETVAPPSHMSQVLGLCNDGTGASGCQQTQRFLSSTPLSGTKEHVKNWSGKLETRDSLKKKPQTTVSTTWDGTKRNVQCQKCSSSESKHVAHLMTPTSCKKFSAENNTTPTGKSIISSRCVSVVPESFRRFQRAFTSTSSLSVPSKQAGTSYSKRRETPSFEKEKVSREVAIRGPANIGSSTKRHVTQQLTSKLIGLVQSASPTRKFGSVTPPKVPFSYEQLRRLNKSSCRAVLSLTRKASVQGSKTADVSAQSFREGSEITMKVSSIANKDKCSVAKSTSIQNHELKSPTLPGKLVEASVQTSEEIPTLAQSHRAGTNTHYSQIGDHSVSSLQSEVTVTAVQTDVELSPQKVDASLQTPISSMLMMPSAWNAVFSLQTQKFISAATSVLVSPKFKLVLDSTEHEGNRPFPMDVCAIPPERSRGNTNSHKERQSASLSSSPTAEAFIESREDYSSATTTPKSSLNIIEGILKSASDILQRHRSSRKIPVTYKASAQAAEQSGSVISTPSDAQRILEVEQENDIPSRTVTVETSQSSETSNEDCWTAVEPDEQRRSTASVHGEPEHPLHLPRKFNRMPPMMPTQISPTTSNIQQHSTVVIQNYVLSRKGDSSSVLPYRSDQLSVSPLRKGVTDCVISPKVSSSDGASVMTPPTELSNGTHSFSDPTKLSKNWNTPTPRLSYRPTDVLSQSCGLSSSVRYKTLLQILQSRNINHENIVMKRLKNESHDSETQESQTISVQLSKKSTPVLQASSTESSNDEKLNDVGTHRLLQKRESQLNKEPETIERSSKPSKKGQKNMGVSSKGSSICLPHSRSQGITEHCSRSKVYLSVTIPTVTD